MIVVHCSATPPGMDIGANEIRRWHLARGWDDIGYHHVIRRSGHIEPGRPEHLPGAHAYGHNPRSIGVCLIGGTDRDGRPDSNFTRHQFAALCRLTDDLKRRYPAARALGHRDVSRKACPGFDVAAFLE